jgi:DNA-binding CsgD family transcriptional regulator
MSSRAGLAPSLAELHPPATLHAPGGIRAAIARVGADELAVLERPAGARVFPASAPTPGGRFAGLNAIHACYAPEPTTQGWLRGVLTALRPLAPSTRWFGWADGPSGSGEVIVLEGEAAVSTDTAGPSVLDALGRECYRDLLRPRPPVQLLSHRLRALPAALERRVAEILRARGVPEAVVLFGGELDGHALALGMVVAPGVRPPSRTIGLLRTVAGHLNTARRLRARLSPDERGAAGITPEPLGGARSLAPRVVGRLASDAFATVDAAAATRLWDELLGGSRAVVDQWAAGGRLSILTRRCQDANDPAALRPAEAAVLALAAHGFQGEEIGHQIGISPATVTLHLTGARARLRCGTRRELVALVTGPALAA